MPTPPSTNNAPLWPWWDSGDQRDSRSKKIAWRLFRQFRSPDEIVGEFGMQPEFAWSVRQTSHDSGSTKLLLCSAITSGINRQIDRQDRRCEAVALYPAIKANTQRKTTGGRLPRATACISSQPGCGVGCPFCATGELGFRGNLTANEIAEQVYWSGLVAQQAGRRLRNVVYMGMGEPLHNTQNVIESIHLLMSEQLFGLPARRITVSTAGVPSSMLRLAREFPDIRIALSLHAAEPELRRQLVPRAVGDLQILRATVAEINSLQTAHPVWIEVVLFERLNDTLAHAQQLVEFCEGLRVEVNLIPYNTAANSGRFQTSSRARREAFAGVLRGAGIRTTIRTSLGQSNNAACGQLSGSL